MLGERMLITIGAIVVLATTAFAQAPADVPPGPVFVEHVDAMVRHFDLDTRQERALIRLLDGYLDDEEDRLGELDVAIREAEMIDDEDDWGAADEKIDELEREERLASIERTERFYEDARRLLEPDQLERWSSWAPVQRRLDLLPKGAYAGDWIDLTSIAREQGVASELAQRLAAYEEELDRALVERYEARREAVGELEGDDPPARDRLGAITAEARLASWEVAQLNREHAERMSEALGAEAGERFLRAYQSEAHGRLFAQRRAGALIGATDELDLDADQRDNVEAIRDEWWRERDRALERLVRAGVADERARAVGVGDAEYPFHALGLDHTRLRRPFEPSQRMLEIERAFVARGDELLERLFGVLSEEQAERLREVAPAAVRSNLLPPAERR